MEKMSSDLHVKKSMLVIRCIWRRKFTQVYYRLIPMLFSNAKLVWTMTTTRSLLVKRSGLYEHQIWGGGLSTTAIATRYSTWYSDFLLLLDSNSTQSQKPLLVEAWFRINISGQSSSWQHMSVAVIAGGGDWGWGLVKVSHGGRNGAPASQPATSSGRRPAYAISPPNPFPFHPTEENEICRLWRGRTHRIHQTLSHYVLLTAVRRT